MKLFHTIKIPGKYWLVDQLKKAGVTKQMYEASLNKLMKEWEAKEYGYMSILLEESSEELLLDQGFKKISTIVEYTRTLDDIEEHSFPVRWNNLSEGSITEQDYASLYERCRSGSANKNKKQPIDEVMNSIKSELGLAWRDLCYYFTLDGKACGVSIPHIEEGTTDEGRMFYFGVVPEMRGRGLGASMHLASLSILKQKNATYYVGSTDTSNQAMIDIFIKNGCTLRDRKGIYRLEKKRK